MTTRNRPPALLTFDVLRVAGSGVGQINTDMQPGFRLDILEHPERKVWGLLADVAISDEDEASVFLVQAIGTCDRGTGKWRSMGQAEMLPHLASMHGPAMWSFVSGIVRQMAAICDTSVDLPISAPEPILAPPDGEATE